MGDVRKELSRVLEDACEEVDRRLDAFLANPDDVETIHKLRISIRTLRSLLAFVSPLLKRRRHRAAPGGPALGGDRDLAAARV